MQLLLRCTPNHGTPAQGHEAQVKSHICNTMKPVLQMTVMEHHVHPERLCQQHHHFCAMANWLRLGCLHISPKGVPNLEGARWHCQ